MKNTRTYFTASVTVIGTFLLMFSTGCGQKTANETAETIIEKKIAKEGQSADVTINPDSKSVSMTINDNNGQQQTMRINVDDESADMVVTGEDGKMTMTSGAAARLPEGFPEDVPMHPSLKLITSLSDGASGFTLQCTTDKEINELVGYYQEACKKSGWTEEMNMSQNLETAMHILAYKKNDMSLNLIFQTQESEVHVTVGVGKE